MNKKAIISIVVLVGIGVFLLYKSLSFFNSNTFTFGGQAFQSMKNILFHKDRLVDSTSQEEFEHEHLMAHLYKVPNSTISMVNGWIPYLYRHKHYKEALGVLLSLLDKGVFQERYVHYFAMIFSQHPEIMESVDLNSSEISEESKKTLSRIVDEARNFHPVEVSCSSNPETIWAEFVAGGDKQLIERYLDIYVNDKCEDVILKICFSSQKSIFQSISRLTIVYMFQKENLQ